MKEVESCPKTSKRIQNYLIQQERFVTMERHFLVTETLFCAGAICLNCKRMLTTNLQNKSLCGGVIFVVHSNEHDYSTQTLLSLDKHSKQLKMSNNLKYQISL